MNSLEFKYNMIKLKPVIKLANNENNKKLQGASFTRSKIRRNVFNTQLQSKNACSQPIKRNIQKGLSSLSDTMAGNDFLCTTMTSYDSV